MTDVLPLLYQELWNTSYSCVHDPLCSYSQPSCLSRCSELSQLSF
jgi:hypothetical protein